MGESLERAIKTSLKGYIDDYDDIDEIMTRLLNVTADGFCFDEDKRKPLINMLYATMETFDISTERKGEVTYGEMICLIDEQKNDSCIASDGRELCEEIRRMLASNFKDMLLWAERSNTTVKLFLSVTVKGFLDYLAKRAGWSGGNALYRKLRSSSFNYLKKHIESDTTIRKFFEDVSKFQAKGWNPFYSIKEYEKNILNSFDDIVFLLIDCFEIGFPEVFDLNKIKEKYGIAPYNEECVLKEAG